ncbi:AAA family ATPase [Anaerotignum sp. MB30-C6]|uniref:AAA family ATPase n=1 Tax=Anaerotignum sp. MB30-C6 TaxID=3070814 RepID=UPI0027DC0187|nr:AAA family ATPase [Anaerotignum sp. MB30-C6]WMI82451.1 AAA family ATPase [Anaerotignum sp. MB30-C6]
MDANNKIALIIGYYFSRFNAEAFEAIGYETQKDAFEAISKILKVNSNSIRNMRDEFDPYFDNGRVGFKQKKLSPSRQSVLNKFASFTFEEMTTLVQKFLESKNTVESENLLIELSIEEDGILRNLNELAQESRQKYKEEFNATDIALSDDFKRAFGTYIRGTGHSVDFNSTTTVVTTFNSLKIFIPNQWFVMAAFMADYTKELISYKSHLESILTVKLQSSKLRKEYIVAIKDAITDEQKADFISNAVRYFEDSGDVNPTASAEFLLNFLSDYSWWFGSKTIDRGDFYVSPILNLLGVVNVTQSYVADIAYFYATSPALLALVPQLKLAAAEQISMPTINISLSSTSRKTGADNYIIYGAPGTGKSRLLEDRFGTAPLTKRVVFHPEYTYFDFVGAYKPVPVYKKNSGDFEYSDGTTFNEGEPYITYKFVPGPFIDVFVAAWKDPSNMYTLVIEEINRANAAAVFGEVFQLLDRNADGESEYAIQPSEELRSYLIGTCEMNDFISSGLKIPTNMNISASMNSADQGVNVLDSAFKRRWKFEYIKIDIGTAVHKDAQIKYANIDVSWGDFVSAINDKLVKLGVDEDRLIGPYFIKPSEVSNRKAVDKLLLYLWDDVLRHRREQFFSGDVATFANLVEEFQTDDVLQISSVLKPAVAIQQSEIEDEETSTIKSEDN